MVGKGSISCFFPCYNDGGTIASMVVLAHQVLSEITDDFEIIVIDDGSKDSSRDVLKSLEKNLDRFQVIYHEQNQGYGGALRSGFSASSKELIFYTDGDHQYDVRELKLLYEKMSDQIDLVNGYKIMRNDPIHRIIIGEIYKHLMRILFKLPFRDIDCDFRLIRKRVFDTITLEESTGSICLEFTKKFSDAGFKFAEVPVHHYFRIYGKSQIFNFIRIFRTLIKIGKLWWRLIIKKDHLKTVSPMKIKANGIR